MTDLHWRLLIIGVLVVTISVRLVYDIAFSRKEFVCRHWMHQALNYLSVGLMFLALLQVFGHEMLPMNLDPLIDTIVRGAGVLLGVFAAVGITWSRAVRKHSWGGPLSRPQTIDGHFLCTWGPYTYVRHPVYASVVLGCAAIEMTVASYVLFAIVPALLVQAAIISKHEERELEATYGDSFRAYMRRTWRLIPLVY